MPKPTYQCPGCKRTVVYQLGKVNGFHGLAERQHCIHCGTHVAEFVQIEELSNA